MSSTHQIHLRGMYVGGCSDMGKEITYAQEKKFHPLVNRTSSAKNLRCVNIRTSQRSCLAALPSPQNCNININIFIFMMGMPVQTSTNNGRCHLVKLHSFQTENRTLKLRSFKQALINFGLGSDRVNPIRTPTPMQNIGDELGKVSLLHSLP